jgi:sugar transferase (PEP-CTERM system associated)
MASFFERETGHVQLDSLNPSWMVFSDGFSRSVSRALVKRLFDITASLVLLLLTAPIMAITTIAILAETGFPLFYRQSRVGECGHMFEILKFRSMRADAEPDGIPRWAGKDDARVTRVGRTIRKLRIDELPQVLNVLKGDMSFVGPRPERPYFVNELSKVLPYYPNRHTVKPGITGWAQIRYPAGDTVEDARHKLQYDLYYAKNHSLFLDIVILLQTMHVILFGSSSQVVQERLRAG